MGADDLHANGDPVGIIEYHNGDPYATGESDARNSYYSIPGYPTAWFDGSYDEVVGGSASQSLYNSYKPIVDARMGIKTSFDVIFGGENDGDDYKVTVRVTKVAEYSGSNLKIRFAVTESDIQYNWQNQTEMNFVCRDMVPNADGTLAEFDDENMANVELEFTINNSWNKGEIEFVAFIQDDATKEVLHSAHVMLNDLEPIAPLFAAGFYSEETGFCDTPAVAYFHSDCIGNPTSYKWTFEGGIPETSLDVNPVVTYLEEGYYDVQLIIANGTDKDTSYVEKYIIVSGKPDVSWNDVPELCNEDWAPYELTEGQPAGGVYSGEYVIDGKYFDPEGLNAGSYPVLYTYIDEAGCENSAEYDVQVVNCVGIGEKEAVSMELYPNPTTGLINISLNADQFNNADIMVVDAVGKSVYHKAGVNVNGTFNTTIDLTMQPQGMYFVIVNGADQRITEKIFVRH